MHVAFVFHSYPPHPAPQPYIEADQTTRQWSKALQKEGIKVTVIHRFFVDDEIEFEGVDYLFLDDGKVGFPRPWQPTLRFNRRLIQIMKDRQVDVIHAHNPFNSLGLFTMSVLLKRYPILVQDHSGVKVIRRKPWWLKIGLSKVQAVVFSAKGQEADWVKKKVLVPSKIHFVMENTSPFSLHPRPAAREASGLKGSPIFLWVGNLIKRKSPFIVLQAFEKTLMRTPDAKLYMLYKPEESLESEVRAWLTERPHLKEAIILLGEVAYDDIELYFNSADYFVAASTSEGSGYAAIEAMSCGLVPILSDIPSFNSLTGDGEVGALFEVGNYHELAEVMCDLMEKPLEAEKRRTVAYYQANFSSEALGKNMKRIYKSLLA